MSRVRAILVAAATVALLGGGLPAAGAGPGQQERPTRPLAWSRTSDPVILRPSTTVRDVSCSPTGESCVAVGHRFDKSGAQVAVAEVWDGVEWRAESPPADVRFSLEEVSCSTTSDCVALESPHGNGGLVRRIFVRSATSWRSVTFRVTRKRSEFLNVSCVLPSWCLLTGADGEVAVFDGNVVRRQPSTPSPVIGVSCTSPIWCVAVSDRYILEWDGTRWSAFPLGNPGIVHDVSCWADERCLAIVISQDGLPGTYVRSPATAWAAGPAPRGRIFLGAFGQAGLDCDPEGGCHVLLHTGPRQSPALSLASWSSGGWAAAPLPPMVDAEPAALGCLPGECVTVNVHTDAKVNPTYASALHFSEGQWTQRAMANPPGRLLNTFAHEATCPTRDSCVVLGTNAASEPYVVRRDGDSWTELPGALADQRDLDCWAPDRCVVVGSDGTKPQASLLLEARWRLLPAMSPKWLAKGTITGVDCVQTRCAYAGIYRPRRDGRGGIFVALRRGGGWRVARLGPPIGGERRFSGRPSVSCPTDSRCVVVVSARLPDQRQPTSFEAEWDGRQWSWKKLGKGFALFEIDCSNGRHCVAGGQADRDGLVMARSRNGTWRRVEVHSRDNGFYSVSCPTHDTCNLAADAGPLQVLTRTGSRWTARAAGPRRMTNIACSGPRACLAFGGDTTWIGR
jgi:hypothetical protein